MKKVIVISAHPDDETLGVGGTILKHLSEGDEVFWIIATDIFKNQGFSLEKRKEAIDEVNDFHKLNLVV